MSTGIGEEDTDLAVLRPPGGSGVLALDAGGPDTFLQEAGVVHDQDCFRIAEMLDDVVTDIGQCRRTVLAPQPRTRERALSLIL
jgi:hypothetical protein